MNNYQNSIETVSKQGISYSQLTLHDLLTVDAYDKSIKIFNPNTRSKSPFVTQDQFFKKDGLYVPPEKMD